MTHRTELAFALGLILTSGFVGYQFGHMTTPKTCPQVEGQKVVSTADRGYEQTCTYSNAIGFNKRTKRI